MKSLFVEKRSDLTLCKELLEKINFSVYRIRTECNCNTGTRDAVIGIDKSNESNHCMDLRCKTCKKGRS